MSENQREPNRDNESSTQDSRDGYNSNATESSQDSQRTELYFGPRMEIFYNSIHSDRYSPHAQANRNSPASTQQYSSWTYEQRQEYLNERSRQQAEPLRYENRQLSEQLEWWRQVAEQEAQNEEARERAAENVRLLGVRISPPDSQRSNVVSTSGLPASQTTPSRRSSVEDN